VSGDEIRAYVLLGCLVAVYPVFAGVKAVEKAFGPEVVVHDGCEYKVVPLNTYSSIKTIEALDEASTECIAKQKKDDNASAVSNYQYEHRKRRRGDEVSQ